MQAQALFNLFAVRFAPLFFCFCTALFMLGGGLSVPTAYTQNSPYQYSHESDDDDAPLSRAALIGKWRRTGTTIRWKRGKDPVTETKPDGFEDVWIFTDADKILIPNFIGTRSVPYKIMPDGEHLQVGSALYEARLLDGKLYLTRGDRLANYVSRFERIPGER